MDEFALLQTIYKASSKLENVFTIGPGDDMGEVQIGDQKILAAVDQLIVGRHVEVGENPVLIGRKAIARCFSDIAAMAGKPIGCLMTACLPSSTQQTWSEAVFQGAREAAEEWGGPIFGGDIATVQEGMPSFTVHAIATPPPSGAIKRRGAQVGDLICVTGVLGRSHESHHLAFSPLIELAQELLQELGESLHCMIDISDGLGQDASHLASKSTQLCLQTSKLPLRNGASIKEALSDGEDYELLFTSNRVPEHQEVTVIGKVVKRIAGDRAVVDEKGNDLSSMGWTHS